MLRSRLALAAISTAAVVAATSCALAGFSRVGAGGGGAGAGGGGGQAPDGGQGGKGGKGTGGMACQHATVPGPPPMTSPPDEVTFVVAVKSVDLGETHPTGANPVGFDLDLLCTCEGDGPSCQGQQKNCDGPMGRDNASAAFFKLIAFALSGHDFGSQFFSQSAFTGGWTLLFRISGYNGTKNDSQVEVAEFVSPGLNGVKPLWKGNDVWPVTASSVSMMDLTKPLYVDKHAYVTDGLLVASLGAAQLAIIGTSSISLTLTGGIISAELAKEGPAWVLHNGTFGARWAIPDVFGALGSYRDDTGSGICTGALSYQVVKGFICGAPDILAEVGSPGQLCDALSFGLAFDTGAAQLGIVKMGKPITVACPAGTDPTHDTCP